MLPTDLLTTEDLAERWRRSPETLANWRRKGIGPPCIRLQGERSPALYRAQDVLDFEETKVLARACTACRFWLQDGSEWYGDCSKAAGYFEIEGETPASVTTHAAFLCKLFEKGAEKP